ncbi:hypothetical protein [Sanguibacter keddieii]|uniref:hypothetical protein n=1 Tax=Sanguibacter keddieii TaxID=60920 RepID=UPI00065FF2A1|nr:hypothetical protein [Sanguibacter keddieii]
MSQPSSNIAPAVSSVPWATPDVTSSMDAPGDRFGYAPGRLRVPSAGLSGPTFPGTQYVDVAAIFADGGYNSPKPIGNPLAKAALWVSVFAIFVLPGLISVVLAIIALVQAQSLPGRVGAREAIAALVFNGILVGGAWILYLIGTIA